MKVVPRHKHIDCMVVIRPPAQPFVSTPIESSPSKTTSFSFYFTLFSRTRNKQDWGLSLGRAAQSFRIDSRSGGIFMNYIFFIAKKNTKTVRKFVINDWEIFHSSTLLDHFFAFLRVEDSFSNFEYNWRSSIHLLPSDSSSNLPGSQSLGL